MNKNIKFTFYNKVKDDIMFDFSFLAVIVFLHSLSILIIY
jgi:hypothetical protein